MYLSTTDFGDHYPVIKGLVYMTSIVDQYYLIFL
jgi:hypothetical protein